MKEPWWVKAISFCACLLAAGILTVFAFGSLYYVLDAMDQVHPDRRCPVLDKIIILECT